MWGSSENPALFPSDAEHPPGSRGACQASCQPDEPDVGGTGIQMSPRETEIGGDDDRFPPTSWSAIEAAGDPNHP